MDKKKDMYSKGGSPMKADMPYGKDYNKGGVMAKSYNKGGYANCGASVKATQKSSK